MKIKVWCNNGANIHSKRQEVIDLERAWGITNEEWHAMPDKEKDEMVKDWMWERLDYGWEDA